MSEGIKLKFDENNNASITTEPNENECFGGTMCSYLEYRPTKVTVCGKEITTKQYWCKHSNTPVNNKCPLKKWYKLAVPIGWQNIGNVSA